MPSYPISCPNCKSRLQIPIKLAPGKKIRCPRCNTIFLFQESPKNPKNQPPEGITRISLKASSRKKEQKDEHISPGKSLPGRGRKKAIFWGAFGSLLLVGTTFFFFPKNIAEKKDGLTLTQVTDNQETDGIAKKDNSQPENKLIPPQQNETPPSTEKPEPTQTQKQPENLAPPSDSKKEENIPQEKPNLTQVILPNAQPEVTNIRPNGQAKAPTLMGGLALPEWEKGLRDEDVKIRLKTLNNLFKLSPSELEWLLPDLHKLMVDDSNTLVRATAARIMGNLGPRALAAVPSLIELVTDKEEPATVRDNAIRTLGKIGPNAKAAVPALIKTLETLGGTEVNSAIQSLLLMETEVVPELIAWMEKEQKLGRENVLKALSLFAKDNNEALQGLGKALSDQEPIIRIKAATELGRLGLGALPVFTQIIKALDDPDEAIWVQAMLLLEDMGVDAKSAIPHLEAIVDNDKADPSKKEYAVLALASIRGPQLSPKDLAILKTHLQKGLSDPFYSQLHKAVLLMGLQGPAAQDSLGDLFAMLRKPDQTGLPTYAMTALGLLGKQSLPQLLKELENPDRFVRAKAAGIAQQLGQMAPETVPLVRKLLKEDQGMQTTAIRALGAMGQSARPAVEDLLTILGDPNLVMRNEAARALANIGIEEEHLPKVLIFLDRKTKLASLSDRTRVFQVLSGANSLPKDIWETLMKDPRSTVVKQAQEFQKVADRRKALALERKWLQSAKEEERLQAGFKILAELPWDWEAMQAVVEGLKQTDADTREKAAIHLGKTGPFGLKGEVLLQLVKTLHDKDVKVKRAAGEAINKIHDNLGPKYPGGLAGLQSPVPPTLEALQRELKDPNAEKASKAAFLLGLLGHGTPEIVNDLRKAQWRFGPVATQATISLGLLGKLAREDIVKTLQSPSSEDRIRAARALQQQGHIIGTAISPVELGCLKDPNPNVRKEIILAMDAMGEAALPASSELFQLMQKDVSTENRFLAAKALVWTGVEEKLVPSLKGMLQQPEPLDRVLAALALIGAKSSFQEPLFSEISKELEILTKEANLELAQHAKLGTELIKDKKSLAEKRPEFISKDPTKSFPAALTILTINPRDISAFQVVMSGLKDANPATRAQAAQCLGTMKQWGQKQEVFQGLAPMLKDPDIKVKQAAIKSVHALHPQALQFYAQFIPEKIRVPSEEIVAPLFAKLPGRTREKTVATGPNPPPNVGTVGPKVGPNVGTKQPNPTSSNPTPVAPAQPEQPIQTLVHLLVPREKFNGRPVVVLEKPAVPGPFETYFRGALARELVRQSFALAIREELGLATRDLGLAETFPPSANFISRGSFLLKCSFNKGTPLTIILEKKEGDGFSPVFKKEVPLVQGEFFDYLGLTKKLEEMARKDWPGILKEQGFPQQNKVNPSQAKSEEKTAELLEKNDYLAQFAAIRELHAAIRDQGESPWLVGDLARAYAHLGRLIEFHWKSTHKICQARSLLYAFRLEVLAPGSPWVSWHQAHVIALAGLPKPALELLATAEERGKNNPTKLAEPNWVSAIGALCRLDRDQMAKSNAPLARFLELGLVHQAGGKQKALALTLAFLEKNPDCYSAWDILCENQPLGILHKVTLAAPVILNKNLPSRCLDLPGFPGAAQKFLKTIDNFGLEEERKFLNLVETSSSLDADNGEIAWSSLAWLVRETRLVQVHRRMVFMDHKLGVPTKDFIDEVQPWLLDHPLHPYFIIRSQNLTTQRPEWKKMEEAIDPLQISLAKGELLAYFLENRKKLNPPSTVFWDHVDDNVGDLTIRIKNSDDKLKPLYARRLLKIDPDSTLAITTFIQHDWEAIEKEALTLEKTKAHQLDILRALSVRYTVLKRHADCERCLTKYLTFSPDHDSYVFLANCHRNQGNEEKWMETLQECLKLPDLGLEQAQIRVGLANYFLGKDDPKKALPYAEAAAETWAEWAMRSAHQCNELLENWERAELWLQRIAERYPAQGREWYHWCCRTGRGNLKEAAAHAQQCPPLLVRESSPENLWIQIHLAILNNQSKTVLPLFDNFNVLTQDSRWFLYGALLAEENNDAAQRDKILKRVPVNTTAGRLAKIFQARLKDPKIPFEQKVVEEWITNDPDQGRLGSFFLLGRILDLTGQKDLALEYYQRSINDPATNPVIRPLAIQAVRSQGKEPDLKIKGQKRGTIRYFN